MSTPRMAWTIRDTSGILIFQMPVPADRAALERDLLRDRAYTTIRDAIVDGTLAPGERLRDQELTEWLGLSRTPLREALSRLQQDGPVQTEAQRYTPVTPLHPRRAPGARPPTPSRSSPPPTRSPPSSPCPTCWPRISPRCAYTTSASPRRWA